VTLAQDQVVEARRFLRDQNRDARGTVAVAHGPRAVELGRELAERSFDGAARQARIIELDDLSDEESRAPRILGLDVIAAVDDVERELVEESGEPCDQTRLIAGGEQEGRASRGHTIERYRARGSARKAPKVRFSIVMSSTQAAVVLGASGSVGNALIAELIRNGSFKPIVTLVRRSQPDQVAMARDAGVELRETLVPAMDPASLERATTDAIGSLEGDVAGLSVLGVGAGTSKLTIDQHRAVDVQLNDAFARALKASGRVKHLAFMSAAGADPTAKTTGSGAAGMARYARVKGEAEEAVKASGPAVVSIFRPAMIIGSQHTPWLLEKVLPVFSFMTPAKYRSITVDQIAKAMVATSVNVPAQSDVYQYPEMIALNR
jgi:uncharacterized protein YbjT (DUF2867 family)